MDSSETSLSDRRAVDSSETSLCLIGGLWTVQKPSEMFFKRNCSLSIPVKLQC